MNLIKVDNQKYCHLKFWNNGYTNVCIYFGHTYLPTIV